MIVFSKPAVPGEVKTRLVPPLTPDQAAEFHLAALTDVLAIALGVSDEISLDVAGGPAALRFFRDRYPDVTVRNQRGSELGERLRNAFDDTFRAGPARAVVVGSDHPSLPATHLTRVLEGLSETDVVIGPSEDGGYYAIAIRRTSWPAAAVLFQDIPWSTPDVLSTTLARAAAAGLSTQLAPSWYDVDEVGDLERLVRDVAADSASARYLHEIGAFGGEA